MPHRADATGPGAGAWFRAAGGTLVGAALVLVHAGVVVGSLCGPALILADTFEAEGGRSFAAWRHVFGSAEGWDRWGRLLGNTGVACAAAVAVSCILGTVLALALFKADIRLRAPMLALLLLAAAIPLHVVNASCLSIIGVERVKGSTLAVGLIHAVAHLPIAILIIGVALRSVPADLEEAALVEGAGPVRLALRVTLRLAAGGIIAAVILVALWVMTDYSVSDVLLVRTFAEEVYTQYEMWRRSAEPALICLPQVVLFGGLLWVFRRGYLTGEGLFWASGRTRMLKTGRWRVPLSVAAGAVALALAATPIASLVPRLARADDLAKMAWSFDEEIKVSLAASLAAGVIAAALGVGLAWFVVRRRAWRNVIAVYVVLMLAIPAPILGVGMIRMFNRPGLGGCLYSMYDSRAILVAAYVLRFLPIALILLIPSVRAIPEECELAAKVDGCGSLATWLRIVWPQCLPGVLIATFVVMVLSLGELPCSLLIAPPGCVTVGARFFSLIHYGLYPDAAMLCLLSMALVVLPWLGLLVLLRKRLVA